MLRLFGRRKKENIYENEEKKIVPGLKEKPEPDIYGHSLPEDYTPHTEITVPGSGEIMNTQEDPAITEEYNKELPVLKEDDGIILGEKDGEVIGIPAEESNKNMAVFGSCMEDTGHSFLMTYIFQAVKRQESFVLWDPAGIFYTEIHSFFEKHDYTVKICNTKDGSIDMVLPGLKKCVYFITVNDGIGSLVAPTPGEYASEIIGNIISFAGKQSLDVPVNIILDDFTGIGIIPSLLNYIQAGAGINLNFLIFERDIEKTVQLYKENADRIFDLMENLIYIDTDNEKTWKFFERMMGSETLIPDKETDFLSDTVTTSNGSILVKNKKYRPLKLKIYDFKNHEFFKETETM